MSNEFKPRTTKPEAGNKYYIRKKDGGWSDAIAGKPTDKDCNVLSNCVGYAYGRFNEIGGYGECRYLSPTNAENFMQYAKGLEVGQTPRLGACMVWRKGATLSGSDGAGHVAIVEKIISPTEIVTSESGWNSKAFWNQTRKKGTGNWGQGSAYTFLGFIYNPAPCCNGTQPAPVVFTGKASTGSAEDEKTIWDFLKGKGLNDYAAAGVMGNLYAESGLRSDNLQQTYERKLDYTDSAYTAAVDNGSYGNFVRDCAGYGLAQWTYWSRKQNLLDFAQAAKKSIADLAMQLDFLWKELQGKAAVMNVLKSAASVREASDIFMVKFEAPANQSEAAKATRAGYGQKYFDKYAAKASVVAPAVAKLTEDGVWGKATTARLQEIFGTPVDGEVSNQNARYQGINPGLASGWDWQDEPNGNGSALVKAMQKWAGMPANAQDGVVGPMTIRAFQKKLGTVQDGKVSKPSQMVKALQAWANSQ